MSKTYTYIGNGRWSMDNPKPKAQETTDEDRGRKPPGFVFGCDSPDRVVDPGHDYILTEVVRMDYADQLIREGRNNVNHSANYIRRMPCPNRWKLKPRNEWADPSRYEEKANRKYPECPSGEYGKVDMCVTETGIWTTIECPVCGYRDFWAAGDGDELF